jgi:IstB-like ATP binding protein
MAVVRAKAVRIGDPTYADAILDRLVHNAHRINLAGDSLRRTRPRSAARDRPAARFPPKPTRQQDAAQASDITLEQRAT